MLDFWGVSSQPRKINEAVNSWQVSLPNHFALNQNNGITWFARSLFSCLQLPSYFKTINETLEVYLLSASFQRLPNLWTTYIPPRIDLKSICMSNAAKKSKVQKIRHINGWMISHLSRFRLQPGWPLRVGKWEIRWDVGRKSPWKPRKLPEAKKGEFFSSPQQNRPGIPKKRNDGNDGIPVPSFFRCFLFGVSFRETTVILIVRHSRLDCNEVHFIAGTNILSLWQMEFMLYNPETEQGNNLK